MSEAFEWQREVFEWERWEIETRRGTRGSVGDVPVIRAGNNVAAVPPLRSRRAIQRRGRKSRLLWSG